MNYGHFGRDLLLELQRTSDDGGGGAAVDMASYNDGLVSQTLQDLKLHVQALTDQVRAVQRQAADGADKASAKPSLAVRPSILLQNAAIQRNKQCLLLYHVHRVRRLQQLTYWNQQDDDNDSNGGVANENAVPIASVLLDKACPAEQDFLVQYKGLMDQYVDNVFQKSLPDEVPDFLRAHACSLVAPMSKVQVRVVQQPADGASMVLDSGATANLTVGSTHYLLYSDVQELLRRSIVQVVDGEEQQV